MRFQDAESDADYLQEITAGLHVVATRPEHARALEELQRVVFPELAEGERFTAEQYLRHIEIFPEGQFAVVATLDAGEASDKMMDERLLVDGEQDAYVVGMTSTLRYSIDSSHKHHTFDEMVDGGWFTPHEPDGPWMYGADVGTHPAFRRRGIARALYAARHEAVRQLGMKGQATVGMMNGYGVLADQMSPEEYYQGILAGEIIDPTVSTQMKIGFEPRGLIRDYLNDPTCGNCGVLLLWPLQRDE